MSQASRELTAIAHRLQQQFVVENARKRGVLMVAIVDGVVGPFRSALLTLFAAVAAVLLIACANLANLMLTRAAGRRKELAVQLALGSARMNVVRQVLARTVKPIRPSWPPWQRRACGLRRHNCATPSVPVGCCIPSTGGC